MDDEEWLENLCKEANGKLKKFPPLYTICLIEDGFIKLGRSKNISVVITGETEDETRKLRMPDIIAPMHANIYDVTEHKFEKVGNEIKINIKSRGTDALIEIEKDAIGKPHIKTIDIQTSKVDLRANISKIKHMEQRYP
ncbi:MAG TPA: hypothetical protein ENL09_06695 [Bacteroidetes bacterium]|nr:hypothetical protein [Bacteroidota bacterium]